MTTDSTASRRAIAGKHILAAVCTLASGCVAPMSDPLSGIWSNNNSHPRMFVTSRRLIEINGEIQRRGSHHRLAHRAMVDRVEADGFSGYTSPATGYGRSYLAREAAFLALVATDRLSRRKYADMAFNVMKAAYTEEKQEKWPHKGNGLGRAMMGLGLALPYDWCHNIWTAEQRDFMHTKIVEALDAWQSYDHPNLADTRGSNWAGVCRGGELILMLCAGEETRRADRYAFLKRELIEHINNGFGDLGVSQEGLGYTEYPGGFVLPAAYACAGIGDDEVMAAVRTRAWWRLAMYTHNFQPHSRKFLMNGVAHSSNFDEGWASLLLNLVPQEQLPYFVWWYDRHMGRFAPGGPGEKFDCHRAGTVWSMLYYPQHVVPRDPTGVYPFAVGDSHGYYFFRNRWRDENDIQASIMADTHHHGHAWDKPEQLAINLMAYNTRFIGGPGKKGGGKEDPESQLFSSLIVDGAYSVKDAAELTGRSVAFEPSDLGAYVIVSGGGLYEKLGLTTADRHMLVYMTMRDNQALFSTLDVLRSRDEHSYTWQANLGSEQDNGDIWVGTGMEDDRPFFVLDGRNNGFVKGWVLHPAGAVLETGDPLRITTRGRDSDIWIVMLVGSGKPPVAVIRGSGLESRITVQGVTISYDQADESIIAEE